MKNLLLFFTFFLLVSTGFATHNRAGEITYRHIQGLTYEITIRTCTDISNPENADRPFLDIYWGDGSPLDSIERVLEVIIIPNVIKENWYIANHTYPGPSMYEIYTEDPNRNAGIINIPNSVAQVFSIKSVLVIGSSGHNNSVQLLNPPKGNACVGNTWIHNPGAFDPDGDSLHYELIVSTGEDCQPVPGYIFPDQVNPGPDNQLTIDESNGNVYWISPQQLGEYNFAIRISEYRNGVFVGSVVRDMQVTVIGCNNNPPTLNPLPDLCVEAGGPDLNIQISGDDPDGNGANLDVLGETFDLANASVFDQPFNNIPEGTFYWSPDCNEVRLNPYEVFVKIEDNGIPISLSNFTTFNITVVGPAPENPIANPNGNSIQLNWDQSICSNVVGYKIYRRVNAYGFEPDSCETGVPAYTGYMFLDSLYGIGTTNYLDNNNVPFGHDICYMVVACFPDGAESYASEEFCARLDQELPVITNSSVGLTSDISGRDTIRWFPPLELDTFNFTGPYHYEIFRGNGFNIADQFLFETNPTMNLNTGQLEYIDLGLNTEDDANVYQIKFFNNDTLHSFSNVASTIYLQTENLDNQIHLTWTTNVPWLNYNYEVFRFNDVISDFELIGTTSESDYLDTNLINGREYCYYIKSFGNYDEVGFPDPLINYSNEKCGFPFDNTPPCPPELSVSGECELENYVLSWTNPNTFCADDVTQFNIYHSPIIGGEYSLIATIDENQGTTFEPEAGQLVGCYVVTALDSLLPDMNGQLMQNESEFSNSICLESCPEYMLPNVFTPNGDGFNELFHPFPYRYIESVDMNIFNRWGELVFRTEDPDILWDGTHFSPRVKVSKNAKVSDGVYYYMVVVNQITLAGIVPFTLHGYIHVFIDEKNRFE